MPAAAIAAQPGTAEQASHGKPSADTTPEARLVWSKRPDSLRIRLSTSDRDAEASEANADLLLGRLRAQYESGRDDQKWQPFTVYQPSLICTPTFARRVDAWNALGFGGEMHRPRCRFPPRGGCGR